VDVYSRAVERVREVVSRYGVDALEYLGRIRDKWVEYKSSAKCYQCGSTSVKWIDDFTYECDKGHRDKLLGLESWEYGVPPWFMSVLQGKGLVQVLYRSRSTTMYGVPDEVLKAINTVLPGGATTPEENIEVAETIEKTRPEPTPEIFSDIVGLEDVKDILLKALKADKPVHVLIVGGPATAKTMILEALSRFYDVPVILAGASTRAGLRDYIVENVPEIMIIDELDKVENPLDLSVLLTWMETQKLTVTMVTKKAYVKCPTVCKVIAACLAKDTIIPTNKHPKYIYEISSGDTVFSLKDGKLTHTLVLEVIPRGVQDVYELRTYTRKIKATLDHEFLVFVKEKDPSARHPRKYRYYLTWKKLADIKPGDLIAIARELPYQEETPKIEIKEVYCTRCGYVFKYPREKVKERRCPKCRSRRVVERIKEVEIDEKLAEIAGLFLGDGYIHKNKYHISFAIPKTNPAFNYYYNLIKELFGNARYTKSEHSGEIQVNSINATKVLMKLGFKEGRQALHKRVPDWVFTSPNNIKLAFLRGYLDADGTVKPEGIIAFGSTNKRLIEDLWILCISLGLRPGNIYEKRLRTEFKHEYGTYSYDKIKYGFALSNPKLNQMIGSHNPVYLKRLTNPRRRGYSKTRELQYKFYPDVGRAVKLPDNVAVDRVRSIKYVGKEEVYDIAIDDESHNFVANGIVVHNCNSIKRIPPELLSRFVVVNLKPYTDEEVKAICINILKNREGCSEELAGKIADSVVNKLKSKDPRDCVKIARLAKTPEEVDKVVEILIKRK
jgi:intein/homing endonuclease